MNAARPRVLVNFAVSLDGKINPVPSRCSSPFVMSRGCEDRRRMLALRARADAILVGANNVRTEDPDLALDPGEREGRKASGRPLPYRVVVTHLGQAITPHLKVFDTRLGGPAILVHPAMMLEADRAILAPVARLVELGKSAVDMPGLLEWLSRELHVETLLCEGGGIVCAELFAARAVDELYLTVVPRVLGGRDAPTVVEGAGFAPDEVPDARLASVEQIGDELFLRYEFPFRAG